MQEHEKRVIVERNELNVKRKLLIKFFETDLFDSLHHEDKLLLSRQQIHMFNYEETLDARILRFQK